MSKAIYIGSFDPFTNGHLDVLEQAVNLFDEIYVVIGVNDKKKRRYTVESTIEHIKSVLIGKGYYNKIRIISESGLATDISQTFDADYIIRGLRNTSDYLFEEQVAQVYKAANPKIKICYFYANNNYSSSMVKYLLDANKNVSKYISGCINFLEKI